MTGDESKFYETIGSLKTLTEEHGKQLDKQSDLLRELTATVATKEDIGKFIDPLKDLDGRVVQLESDKRLIKAAIVSAFGAPPTLAAVIEIFKVFLHR